MSSTAKLSFLYKADLVARDFNDRFADFFGGSIMKGFRFGVSDKNGYISLLKGADDKNLIVTHNGVSIEDEDQKDVIYIHPNGHASNSRIDTIYVVHIHGTSVVTYIVISGNADTGEAAPLKPKETHTLLGYVLAPPNNLMVTNEHLKPMNHGLKDLRVEGNALVNGNLSVGGSLDIAGDVRLSGTVHRSAFATVNKAGFMTATDKQTVKTLVDTVNDILTKLGELEKIIKPEEPTE